MSARGPARYLAPLALAAVIGGVVLIVEHETAPKRRAVATATATTTSRKARGRPTKPAPPGHHEGPAPTAGVFYTVKSGDSLSAIAVREHVSVATLEALNPHINPNNLHTGSRLRLRR